MKKGAPVFTAATQEAGVLRVFEEEALKVETPLTIVPIVR